jgi:predicted transposase YdaD
VAVALALEAKGNPAIVEMKEESRRKGHAAGLAEGRAEGLAQALLTILAVRGVAVPEAARERILGTQDPETLDRWLLRAGTAISLEEVLTKDPSGP